MSYVKKKILLNNNPRHRRYIVQLPVPIPIPTATTPPRYPSPPPQIQRSQDDANTNDDNDDDSGGDNRKDDASKTCSNTRTEEAEQLQDDGDLNNANSGSSCLAYFTNPSGTQNEPSAPASHSHAVEINVSTGYTADTDNLPSHEHSDAPAPSPTPAPADIPSPYSLDQLLRLAEDIPAECFPTRLIVYDPFDLSFGNDPDNDPHFSPNIDDKRYGDAEPMKYRRLYPAFRQPASGEKGKQKEKEESIAHLSLAPDNLLGIGTHSQVYACPFDLPSSLTTNRFSSPPSRPNTVRLSVKVALPTQEARSRLQHEAGIYNGFPSYMCEEYCGYHLLTRMMQSPVPSVRVVPNFYGYYVPVKKTKSLEREQGGKERILWPWEGRSPILLTEDCGWPVHVHKLDVDERKELYSLLTRLHVESYVHNSVQRIRTFDSETEDDELENSSLPRPMTLSKFLIQPGPLAFHPKDRTYQNPTFRIIGFGETELRDVGARPEDVMDMDLYKETATARDMLGFDQCEPI